MIDCVFIKPSKSTVQTCLDFAFFGHSTALFKQKCTLCKRLHTLCV